MILKISGLYVEYERFYSQLNLEKMTFSLKPDFFDILSNKIEIPAENFLLKVLTKIFLFSPHNH